MKTLQVNDETLEINEQMLVSFGNYLFERYNVKSHDSMGEVMGLRQVTDADLQNYKFDISTKRKLPSAFQPGESVDIVFGVNGTLSDGRILKVHFTDSKVMYDIEIEVEDGDFTRLYNVDSVFVEPCK